MISRLAAGPRICPSCRLGPVQRRAFRAAPLQRREGERFQGDPGRWVDRQAVKSREQTPQSDAALSSVNQVRKPTTNKRSKPSAPPLDPFLAAFASLKTDVPTPLKKYSRGRNKDLPAWGEGSVLDRPPEPEPTPEEDPEVEQPTAETEDPVPSTAQEMTDATMASIDRWLAPRMMSEDNVFLDAEFGQESADLDTSQTDAEMADRKTAENRERRRRKAMENSGETDVDPEERAEGLFRSLKELEDDHDLEDLAEGNTSQMEKYSKTYKSQQRTGASGEVGLPDEWDMSPKNFKPREAFIEDSDELFPDVDEAFEEEEEVFKHDLLHQSKLNIGALGKSVDAIVINNPNKLRYGRRASRIAPEMVTPPDQVIDLKKLLDFDGEAEEGTSAIDEAIKMLEAKRLGKDRTVTKAEFDDLHTYLADGLTAVQLREYYSRKERQSSALTGPSDVSYPWITGKGEWEGVIKHNVAEMTPKQHLIHLILTRIWKLEIKEDLETVGWMPVYLETEVFKMLSQPSSAVIQDLKNDFLDTAIKEDVALDAEGGKLDIFTKKLAVPAILARIDGLLKSMTVQKISVGAVKPEDLQKEALDELARVTNTNIRSLKRSKQLEVSWIPSEHTGAQDAALEDGKRKRRPHLETPADQVHRLLNPPSTAYPTEDASMLKFSSSGGEEARVAQTREKSSMSWRDRQRTWFRLYSAAKKPTKVVPGDIDEEVLKLKVGRPDHNAAETGAAHHLSVTFGHVLHLTDGSKKSEEDIKERHRILSPVLPHPAALTALTQAHDDQVSQTAALILNFSPKSGVKAPDVRLKVPLHTDGIPAAILPEEAELSAAMPWYFKDVLFPDQSVDARFEGTSYLPLDTSQKSIQDLLAVSQLNTAEGPIRTPTKAQITIPKSLVTSTAKASKTPDAFDIPYMFQGADIHRTVDFAWRGHTLRYSSVEAGQHGGTRQQLSLHAISAEKGGFVTGQAKAAFLKLAQEIVKGESFSWTSGANSVQHVSTESIVQATPLVAEATVNEPLEEEQAGYQVEARKAEAVPQEEGASIAEEEPNDHIEEEPEQSLSR